MDDMGKIERPIFRDRRRYLCDYCGICRSKKYLLTSHILTHHKEEMEEIGVVGEDKIMGKKSNTCSECGATFRKPAYLKQHMQSHSLERAANNLLAANVGAYESWGECLKMLLLEFLPADCNDINLVSMSIEDELFCRNCPFYEMLKCEALDPRTKNSKMHEASSPNLNGLVSGGRPPEKLLQASPSFTQCFQVERPYTCPVDDCHSSYRRKDHLTRHLLWHQGKLFKCQIESCSLDFSFQGNMKRHVKEFHCKDCPPTNVECRKEYVCREIGCGRVFRFASKLQKHEGSHVKLDSVEAFCCEPGCMKYFANDPCLKAHIQSCHQHITCEICGTKRLKKNIKRHLRMHEARVSLERVKCNYKGCLHTFSSESNLRQHMKAVHFELKPFACSFSGCGTRFAYKHVRDNHEKTGNHVYTPGDFEELDEQFQSRSRGGRKRKCPTVEMLIRKRVTPPSQLDVGSDYLAWLLSQHTEDEQ